MGLGLALERDAEGHLTVVTVLYVVVTVLYVVVTVLYGRELITEGSLDRTLVRIIEGIPHREY